MKKRTLIISLSILGVLLLAGVGVGAAFALLNKYPYVDQTMHIKIVNKSSNPLYINYFQTYGKEVKIIN